MTIFAFLAAQFEEFCFRVFLSQDHVPHKYIVRSRDILNLSIVGLQKIFSCCEKKLSAMAIGFEVYRLSRIKSADSREKLKECFFYE